VAATMVGQADVVGVLDSPFWIPIEPWSSMVTSFEEQIRQLLHTASIPSALLDDACRAAHADELWKCVMAAFRLHFVRTPHLISQSQYDNFGISTNLHPWYDPVPDLDKEQMKFAEQYRARLRTWLHPPKPGSAIFSTACYTHCTISHPEVSIYRAQGMSLPDVLARWLSAASPKDATIDIRDDCEGFDCGRRNIPSIRARHWWAKEQLASKLARQELAAERQLLVA